MESAFSFGLRWSLFLVKLQASKKTSSGQACNRACARVCLQLQAVEESVFIKALGLYNEWH